MPATACSAPAAAADSVGETRQVVEKAIESQPKTRDRVDPRSQEKDQLEARILNLQNRLRYLHYQQEQHASYFAAQQEKIRTLAAKRAKLETLQIELEPYLNTLVQRLRVFVEGDLPFLAEERQKRLVFLEESLADYNLKPSEKLRRVLEALQVETEYGRYPEVSDTFLELNGQSTKVRVLRLGRLAMYYLTHDGEKAGRYDREQGEWVALPRGSARELRAALEMVEKSRVMEIVDLPVAR